MYYIYIVIFFAIIITYTQFGVLTSHELNPETNPETSISSSIWLWTLNKYHIFFLFHKSPTMFCNCSNDHVFEKSPFLFSTTRHQIQKQFHY